jgi:hypothetical protein
MIEKIYTKYKLTDVDGINEKSIKFYAKVSESKITLRNERDQKDFQFTNSSPELVNKMCKLILGVLNIKND